MEEKARIHPPKFSKEKLGRVHIFISGLIQGVFFRANTQKKAEDLGITGWVKNVPDGRVEIVAEGERQKVEDLIEWAKKGPLIARVDNLDIEWQEYVGEFDSFETKY